MLSCQELLILLQHINRYEYANREYYCVDEENIPLIGISSETLSRIITIKLYCWHLLGCLEEKSIYTHRIVRPPSLVLLCIERHHLEKVIVQSCATALTSDKVASEAMNVVSNPKVFLRILQSSFKQGFRREEELKELLKKLLSLALPTCIINGEQYVSYDRSRADLFIECKDFVIVIEIKSPQSLGGTPSRYVAHQTVEILRDLEEIYKMKKAYAVIVLRTDGGPVPYLYELKGKRRVHVLSRYVIDKLEGYCIRKKITSVYALLKALAEARIDTIHMEERELAKY